MGWDGIILFDKYVDVPAMTAEYMKRVQEKHCCAKCTPGKRGTRVMMDTLARILAGQGEERDLDTLAGLADYRDPRLAAPLVLGIAYKKNVDDMRESPAVALMELLQAKGAAFIEYDVTDDPIKELEMRTSSGRSTVPEIFVDDLHVGGCDELYALEAAERLEDVLGL